MTQIFERVLLTCSHAQARGHMNAEFLRETLALDAFALTVERVQDSLRFDERFDLTWTPKGSALLPHFSGEIVLRAAEDGRPMIELVGQYAPPFGVPGKAFDMVIGSKISVSTAKALLRQIADAIDALYVGSRTSGSARSLTSP